MVQELSCLWLLRMREGMQAEDWRALVANCPWPALAPDDLTGSDRIARPGFGL